MEFTPDILGSLILMDPLVSLKEINGIERSESGEWRVGMFELCWELGEYRPITMGFCSGFTETSRFRVMDYSIPDENLQGVGLIFRLFDQCDPKYRNGPEDDGPDELFVGWMALDRKAEAESIAQELNASIQRHLQGRLPG